jgi:urocanate hydratase
MNVGRRFLNQSDLAGTVFLTSGLGGMSGAQAKAAVVAGCVGVIAEVSRKALLKRHEQGWLMEWTDNLDSCIDRVKQARRNKEVVSIGYLGNIVDLWERVAAEYQQTGELLVELGSDQTSLHNPYGGGYYPVQLDFEEAQEVMKEDPQRFKDLVQESLRRQVAAINKLADAGMHFWDYGNAFLLEASRAGAAVNKPGMAAMTFRYPSYVQTIMGDYFSLGFGPFRWVCTSGLPSDLALTDSLALQVMEELATKGSASTRQQYTDNCKWIREAGKHQLVVGSQARILYSNEEGRVAIALAFNKAIGEGKLKGPVVLSRDHHDVSGSDSPFRETSNVEDGSKFCADMAVQNVIGDSFRGATWVAVHNGGGVGWGEVINGGFGLLLDGSEDAADRAKMMLSWDILNGIARRSWSGHPLANETLCAAMAAQPKLVVTLSHQPPSDDLLDDCL